MKKKQMTMLLGILAIALIILFCLSTPEADTHDGEAKAPASPNIEQGRQYETVLADFQEAGFTNITLAPVDDLITGLLTKDGEVESVSIAGNEDYSTSTWYPNDVKVIITYHTFPEASETFTEGANDTENAAEETPTEDPTENDETTPEPTPTPEPTAVSNLTVENCPELATMLTLKSESDPAYAEFAKNHRGETIELDACIIHVMNHGDYDTRYDILLNAGNYVDANTVNPGPYFKFEDVNTHDMSIHDLYLPDFVKIGSNVHIIAKVEKFDTNSSLFFLDPVSVEER